MSRLTELLRVVKQLDGQLGADLETELQPLQRRLPFGLNFERHAPEAVELPGHKVRTGSKVRILPPRGDLKRGDQRLWLVTSLSSGSAQLTLLDGSGEESISAPVEDLVLVSEFRDQIFPGLRQDPGATIYRNDAKPFHTVINGENFHVLKLLTFTHAHSVDAIYIDPPYNTGARDWKYNNDYVEGEDLYRHSKWLAFMERRLKLAKDLLKPDDSVLIVTIDEKEYLRLGLLLGQVFPEATVTMVASNINPGGSTRRGTFARAVEYIYFVQLGASEVHPLPLSGDWDAVKKSSKEDIHWHPLQRTGQSHGNTRAGRPKLFYPVFVRDTEDGPVFDSVGDAYVGDDWQSVTAPDGTAAVWPIRSDGAEGCWGNSAESLRDLIARGYARLGKWKANKTAIYFLQVGMVKKVESGDFTTIGHRADGSVITDSSTYQATFIPEDMWRVGSHDASRHGSNLLKALLPDRKFPFPKSLYAVEDALRFFVHDNPTAVVLDFFAGSGTTAQAVMRLNRQDQGSRQCISVTNNEVGADEQAKLRLEGLRPGDEAWEQYGICEHITKPRIRAAITGETPAGIPLKGEYRFVDEFPMADGFDENAAFFSLIYESPWRVSTNRAFAAIAPMLWLRAGAKGRRIDQVVEQWEIADTYGIIKNLDEASQFVAAVRQVPAVRIAYIVTDDEGRYQQVADELAGVETVRLYEDYLRNCQNNVGD